MPPEAAVANVAFLVDGTIIFLLTVVVLTAALATLLAVPYAFVAARDPQRRFWGERAPLGRVLLWLAAVFVPLGLVLGAMSPRPQTVLTFGRAVPSAPAHSTAEPPGATPHAP